MMESGDDHQQVPENSGDQQVTSQVAAAKSYECTFCKRGFSNAQALGGHMNIHRKDKAKLKQVSSSAANTVETKQQQQQQRLPLEIPKMMQSYSPILPKINPSSEAINMPHHADHIERSTATTKRASSWPADWFRNDKEGDNNQLSQQLPLFSQASSDQDHYNQGGQQQQQQQQEDHGNQSDKDSDLDLELRLWPESQDSSSKSPKATTRKFF